MPFRRYRGPARIERGEALPMGAARGRHTRSAPALTGLHARGQKVWVDLKLLLDPVRDAKTMGFHIDDAREVDGAIDIANTRGDYVRITR